MGSDNWMKTKIKCFFSNQLEAIGVVEIILILVIIIGLVLLFREQITEIVNNILDTIMEDAKTIADNKP